MKALLRDAWRGLRARAAATVVAHLGLMLALASGLLVALLALALAATDPAIPDADRVVMLDFKGNPPGQPSTWFTASPVFFGPALKARGVALDLVSRTHEEGMTLRVAAGPRSFGLRLADPDIVPLLGLRALHGDLATTLRRPEQVAVTPHMVRELWGDLPPAQALGRALQARGQHFTVGAVLQAIDARNPLAGQDILAGYDSLANPRTAEEREAVFMVNGRVFARLRAGTSLAQVGPWMRDAFLASPGFQQLPKAWHEGREAAFFRGVSLSQLPFEGDTNGQRWSQILALAVACTLLLWMATINALNLQSASLLQRQRETALRRSLGASARQVGALWAAEATLALLLAGAGALLLAWWLAPALAIWMRLPPDMPLADPLPVAAWAGLALVLALLLPATLALPAHLALRQPMAAALQGRTASEGPAGRRWRQGLLALQLACTLLLLALSGVLAAQHQHLLHADRGFATHNRLVLTVYVEGGLGDGTADSPEHARLGPLALALGQDPAVQSWAFSNIEPAATFGGQRETYTTASRQQAVLKVSKVSPTFFATYGMHLLAGDPAAGGSAETRVVLDAHATRQLGFASPQAAVGALLQAGGEWLQAGNETRRVVAVVADVKLEPGRDAAQPQAFVLHEAPQFNLTLFGPDLAALEAAVHRHWARFDFPFPPLLFCADEARRATYRQEGQLTALLLAVSVWAMAVAATGAYALVADTLRRRRTEIVLHRLHGADTAAVVGLLLRELAAPLVLAVAVALPLAAWLAGRYLDGFVDRVPPGQGLLPALAGAVFITLGVLGGAATRHTQQALALRPAQALA